MRGTGSAESEQNDDEEQSRELLDSLLQAIQAAKIKHVWELKFSVLKEKLQGQGSLQMAFCEEDKLHARPASYNVKEYHNYPFLTLNLKNHYFFLPIKIRILLKW